MRVSEIQVADALEGVNWVMAHPESDDPMVRKAETFEVPDVGLFSAVIKMNDGSEHPALIVKDFADGGVHTGTYVYTKSGWLNLFADGFMRAVGRYHHDIFPFEIFVARPWRGDKEIQAEGPEKVQEHMENFRMAAQRIRAELQKV